MNAVRNWFSGLTMRERILVGIAAGFTLLLAAVYLVTLPLLGAISDQRIEYREALERRTAIEARVKTGAGKTTRKRSAMSSNALQSTIDISAGEAGFTLDRAEARQGGQVDVAIANARPTALMQWLVGLQSQGIAVSNVEIKPGANGSVGFTATFGGVR